ncbi:HNH endonuclease [Zunongwangia sp. HRR-M8]|uniref:HNH endonuclease n=1 Tax=Zunongwangia sp. HRR-M8 TaxID=3015170 RepID=UPI0022DD7F89|nr:HNH endonuclease [Zunongwangia sp. HRR-M8]WBL21730.1 HNH endonuclease [Zunongwangia sp. HRR-M8]
MVRSYFDEEWKEVIFDDKVSEKEHYKISNFGRVIRITETGEEELQEKKYGNGYEMVRIKLKNSVWSSRYVHKLMAQLFLERKEGQRFVIHLNYDKKDNRLENLKWATKREKEIHQFSNPENKNIVRKLPSHAKLTETKVKFIKRKIFDPNRRTRLKMIAKQFGISEMQLHRIKTGENWGHVTEY